MSEKTDSKIKELSFLKNGVQQVALVVENLEQTVENYWKYLGVGPWHFYTYGEAPTSLTEASFHGQPAHYKMRVALSYLGTTRIELIQPLEGESQYVEFIKNHGYGLNHLGIVVTDMEAALAEAQEAGFEILMDGSGFGVDGDGRYVYLDTEKELGFILELIIRPKQRFEPEKIYPAENES